MPSRRVSKSRMETYSPERWAWVRYTGGQVVAWVETEEGGTDVENIKLMINLNGRQPARMNLTACTVPELVALRELINETIDWAFPLCAQRDQEAQNAADEGDDSFSRNYRQLPQLVYRKRPEYKYGQGLLDGSQDAPEDGANGDDPDGGVRDARADLAQRDASERRAQDDRPPTDFC